MRLAELWQYLEFFISWPNPSDDSANCHPVKELFGPGVCPGVGDSWALWFCLLTMHMDKPSLFLSSLVV